jgi:hypothetical protein
VSVEYLGRQVLKCVASHLGTIAVLLRYDGHFEVTAPIGGANFHLFQRVWYERLFVLWNSTDHTGRAEGHEDKECAM